MVNIETIQEPEVIGVISSKGMSVEVVEVPRLTGYQFRAVNTASIPLAADLAVMQTQKGQFFIDRKLKGKKD